MKKVEEVAQNVKSKDDFTKFVGVLIQDLNNNSNTWENKNLSTYLEAIQSWVEDMEGYYVNNNLPIPENVDWRFLTNILMSAKMYE